MEKELFELDVLIDSSAAGIVINRNNKIVYANKPFQQMLNYTLKELRKMPLTNCMRNDYRHMVLNRTKARLKGKKVKSRYEIPLLDKHGNEVWVDLSASRIFYQGKSATIATFIDITRRKKAEQELKRFRKISDQARDSIFIIDKNNAEIVDVNKTACVKLGYSKKKLLSMKVWDVEIEVFEKNISSWENHMKQLKNINNDVLMQGMHQKKDQSIFPVEVALSSETYDDKEYVIAVARDVSDRKKTQDKLNLTLQELSDRNFELDQIVYKISHDLRSPLTTILGLINVIKEDKSDSDNYINLIESRINKLDEFIKSMLSYATTSRSEIHQEAIHLNQLINQCLDDISHLDNFSNIEIKLNISKNSQIIESDPILLHIIFQNLFSNSVKYMDSRKESSFIKVGVTGNNGILIINISDNGIGIPKVYQDKIFGMFFRGTKKSDGSGLGLYIVNQVVKKLNGNITFNSTRYQGTTFNIQIPL